MPSIRFTRTAPGRYHAANGLNISNPLHASVVIQRDGRGWTATYYRAAATQFITTMTEDTMGECRDGARAVLEASPAIEMLLSDRVARLHFAGRNAGYDRRAFPASLPRQA